MKYLLTLWGDESRYAERTPEQTREDMKGWDAFTTGAIEAGVHVGGEGLEPSATATTVQITEGGDAIVTDGPFAETKEQIAGYDVIDCADLDEAIDIAARHPVAAWGTVEIRPFWTD